MLDILKFACSGFWIFWGSLILITIIGGLGVNLVAGIIEIITKATTNIIIARLSRRREKDEL